MHFQELCASCVQNKTSEISKNELSGILGLLCAEQDVGNLNKCTCGNSGTPVRRTKRQKSQNMHFRVFWDSCAQNKTSEISKHALSVILGLLCAEQNGGHLNKNDVQEFWDPFAQNKTWEISSNGLLGILGLLCAEPNGLLFCHFLHRSVPVGVFFGDLRLSGGCRGYSELSLEVSGGT